MTLLLNWLVNKNNPIFPYFGFALLGAAIMKSYLLNKTKWIVPTGVIVFVVSMTAYILLPDTMLERQIDLIWFAIMWAQAGIFLLLVSMFVKIFHKRKPKHVFKFIERFGYAGLTPFFFESVFAALVYGVMEVVVGPIKFGIAGSLFFGLALALFWGGLLILAEKKGYPGFVEQIYVRLINRVDISTKGQRLSKESK